MEIIRCNNCGDDKFYLKKKGPHVGVYCQVCDTWISWISITKINIKGDVK